jgi:hypothetical protein
MVIKRIAIIAFFSICPVLFAQQSSREQITYTGVDEIRKTVSAYFMGYGQEQYIFVQNGNSSYIETYMSMKLTNMNEWSNYEYSGRQPAPKGIQSLTDAKNLLDYGYHKYGDFGVNYNIGGNTVLKIMAAPTGKSTSTWWGSDGNSFYIFSKFYAIGDLRIPDTGTSSRNESVHEVTLYLEGSGNFTYSISNDVLEMNRAIKNRTGITVDLNTVSWRINTGLAQVVKNMMNTNNVVYSMTVVISPYRFFIVNKRVGNQWYFYSVEY